MQLTAGFDALPTATASRAEALTLAGITVTVRDPGGGQIRILDIPALHIAARQSVGIAGPSGAGKTSLLHAIAGLLQPSAGTVSWGGEIVSAASESARDRWRRRTAGLVFQDFELVPELSVLSNVLLPASFGHWRTPTAMRVQAAALAGRLGIAKLSARVASLSRGEQQRVAVARALFGSPALILADEPTASLDQDNGAAVAALLMDSARSIGATFIVVSHDTAVLSRLDRVIRLENGRVAQDSAQ
jgi:ABC-type lipoprotein export system ATPase subunit